MVVELFIVRFRKQLSSHSLRQTTKDLRRNSTQFDLTRLGHEAGDPAFFCVLRFLAKIAGPLPTR